MIKTVLYIATTLDGYIARPDGNLDWLTSVPNPKAGDYGYAELLSSIGTTIMGRKTYDEIMAFGIDWPYEEYNSYVVTNNKHFKIQSPKTAIVTENIKGFIQKLKKNSSKDIWLVGGGHLVTKFINEDLLDKIIISVIPKIIGEGIPLFAGKPKETEWKLIDAKPFETGVVNMTYEKV